MLLIYNIGCQLRSSHIKKKTFQNQSYFYQMQEYFIVIQIFMNKFIQPFTYTNFDLQIQRSGISLIINYKRFMLQHQPTTTIVQIVQEPNSERMIKSPAQKGVFRDVIDAIKRLKQRREKGNNHRQFHIIIQFIDDWRTIGENWKQMLFNLFLNQSQEQQYQIMNCFKQYTSLIMYENLYDRIVLRFSFYKLLLDHFAEKLANKNNTNQINQINTRYSKVKQKLLSPLLAYLISLIYFIIDGYKPKDLVTHVLLVIKEYLPELRMIPVYFALCFIAIYFLTKIIEKLYSWCIQKSTSKQRKLKQIEIKDPPKIQVPQIQNTNQNTNLPRKQKFSYRKNRNAAKKKEVKKNSESN